MARKRTATALVLPLDPYESAKVAGLRYVVPDGPGIVRKSAGSGFSYIAPDGTAVRDPAELERFQSLVIPPAWTSVWICPSKNGHIQAVGRDARGRKQYRYHPLYRQVRDQTKFGRMIAFAGALPKIRARVEKDLALSGLPKAKVLATVVRLLESTCIRVGNEEYAKTNDSYGLTTMKEDHVEISGRKLRFHFRGKSGLIHDIELSDPRLAKIVRQCQCIPGEELFHYVDAEGQVCKIHSEDVNDYLREITGDDFTAKDFRTWAGTGHAALLLKDSGRCETQTETKKNLVAAIKAVSHKLGNRPATCRKYYIHPAILEAYVSGALFEAMQAVEAAQESPYALRADELCVLALLQSHVTETVKATTVKATKAA